MNRRWLRTRAFAGVALMAFGVLTVPAIASMRIDNHLEANVSSTDSVEIYDYGSGRTHTLDADDWANGEHDDTRENPTTGALQLAPGSRWDTDWRTRRCWTVDNAGPRAEALEEYAVRLVLDTTEDLAEGRIQPDGADVRALAADDDTELPVWVEGPVGDAETAVWVQLDAVPVGESRVCLYWNNPDAASVSDEASVFTYDAPRTHYHTASRSYTGAGNGGRLDVVSFVDDNTITVGGVTQNIDAGQVAIFNGVDQHATVASTGPLAARGRGDATDSVVPISFAGTRFVFPTNRGNQRWSLKSPFGDADVRILNGRDQIWRGAVTQAGGTLVVTADIGANRSGLIEVLNDTPIIVTHASTQNHDGLVVSPFTGADLYGVRGRHVHVGFTDAGSDATIFWSDGNVSNIAGAAAGSFTDYYDAADSNGNGTAARVTGMTGPTGALQQADRDGLESTMFQPEDLLSATYALPTEAQYVAFACPTPGTVIELVGFGQVVCSNAPAGHPGHAWIGGNPPAGTIIRSVDGSPFYAYYEDRATDDETNLFGMKAHRQRPLSEPTLTAGEREDVNEEYEDNGTWTSGVIDTTTNGVFGLLEATADLPAGTSVKFQLSSGPDPATATAGPFIGPDGTETTFYDPTADPIDYRHDGDRYLVVRAVLETTDRTATPTVTAISFGCELEEVPSVAGAPMVLTVPTPPGDPTTRWLTRVNGPTIPVGTTVSIRHGGDAGLANVDAAAVRTDTPTTQVEITAGAITQTVGPEFAFDADHPYSIAIDATLLGATADVDVTITASVPPGTKRIERDLRIELR